MRIFAVPSPEQPEVYSKIDGSRGAYETMGPNLVPGLR